MKPLWAIANKMIIEGLRMKVTLFFIIFLVFVIPTLPFVLESDGTLKGQIQLSLTYTIALSAFFLYLLAIFLAIISFTGEIASKQVLLVDTKPVARWQFFLGKWLGIALLTGAMLTILGLAVYGLTEYLYHYKAPVQQRALAQRIVREEILTAARWVAPRMPERWIAEKVQERIAKYQKTHDFPAGKSEQQVRAELTRIYTHAARIVGYRQVKIWRFTNLPVPLRQQADQYLRLRYKFYTSRPTAYEEFAVKWVIGKGARAVEHHKKVLVGAFHEIRIPATVIEPDGTLEAAFYNDDYQKVEVYFPPQNGLELYYPVASFAGNLVRLLLLIYCQILFLAMFALFAATFLTFPVATLVALVMLLFCLSANFLLEVAQLDKQLGHIGRLDLPMLHQGCVLVLQGVCQLVPNFGRYPGVGYLSEGKNIEWWQVLSAVLLLGMIKSGLLALFGCWIYNRRELARPYL